MENTEKKLYLISMPITGIMYMEVEADSQEKALEEFHENVTIDNLVEWECTDKIVGGNVFYGMQNELNIEEEEL